MASLIHFLYKAAEDHVKEREILTVIALDILLQELPMLTLCILDDEDKHYRKYLSHY